MLGLEPLWGARHWNAISNTFSSAKLLAGFRSSFGSKADIVSPLVKFLMAWLYQLLKTVNKQFRVIR